MQTVVLGSGGWGTALGLVLLENGHQVTLWSHNPEHAASMKSSRQNPRLPQVPLPDDMDITSELKALESADLVVFATPSFAVRETARLTAPHLRPGTVLVSVSKGIEPNRHLRMSEIILEEVGPFPIVALSGPSHAEEVGIHLPTGCVAASENPAAAQLVQDAFMNSDFRIYTSSDIIGVELSGAMKNVIALCCGASDGLGFGDNTKALLMTRSMVEFTLLGESLGGHRTTFGGLAGMGDLIVTCTSMHSRNRRAGILIGQGKSIEDVLKEVGGVVEGYYAARSIEQLSQQKQLTLPICHSAYQVLYEGKPAETVVLELMTRAKKAETDEHGPWEYVPQALGS